MLTVGYAAENLWEYDVNFHIGAGRIRQDVNKKFEHGNCLVVHADGHELEAIRQQFSGIPMHTGRTVLWTGETARFIVNNLRL